MLMDAVQRVRGLEDFRCPELDGLVLHVRHVATWEQVEESSARRSLELSSCSYISNKLPVHHKPYDFQTASGGTWQEKLIVVGPVFTTVRSQMYGLGKSSPSRS